MYIATHAINTSTLIYAYTSINCTVLYTATDSIITSTVIYTVRDTNIHSTVICTATADIDTILYCYRYYIN